MHEASCQACRQEIRERRLNATERLRYLAEKIEGTNAGGDSLPTVESIMRDMEMLTAWKQIYTPWDLSVSSEELVKLTRFNRSMGV